MRSPTWNGAAGACAATVETLGPIVAIRSAKTTVNNDAERFIRLSTPLYDARGRRLVATVVFVNGLVAGQIVGVVRIVTVGRATRDIVQHGAEQPDWQSIQHLEFRPRDVAVAVSRPQHDQ